MITSEGSGMQQEPIIRAAAQESGHGAGPALLPFGLSKYRFNVPPATVRRSGYRLTRFRQGEIKGCGIGDVPSVGIIRTRCE